MQRVYRPLVMAVCCFLAPLALAQGDPRSYVSNAVHTELAADRDDHSRWLYLDQDTQPEKSITQWVAQTSQGSLHRVLKRNGASIDAADQRQALDHVLADPSVLRKQRADGQHDDEQAAELLRLLPEAFTWSFTGTRGSSTVLHFRPDPNFKPPDRESQVFAAMEGEMAIDTTQHRIVSLKGRLIHDVDFGWGLLGSLKQGGTFDVERRELAPERWQITETHIHIDGKALLFKSIAQEEDEVMTRWKPLPSELSLSKAAALLLEQNGS